MVIGAGVLEQPAALALDADGLLYVSDMGPQVVKVFDVKSGKLLRTIGKAGRAQAGAVGCELHGSPHRHRHRQRRQAVGRA